MSRISVFLSYRRADTGVLARAVLQFLDDVPVIRKVFLDVVDIEIGSDFKKVIRGDLVQATHVFLLIGPQWSGPADPSGRTRLFGDDDLVRQEVALALHSEVRLVPILVDDARIPDAKDLPDDLQALPSRHAFTVRTAHFDTDMDDLLDRLLGARQGGRSRWRKTPLTPKGIFGRCAGGALAAGALLVGAGVANQLWNPNCYDLTCVVQNGLGISSAAQALGVLSVTAFALLALGAASPLLLRWIWYRR